MTHRKAGRPMPPRCCREPELCLVGEYDHGTGRIEWCWLCESCKGWQVTSEVRGQDSTPENLWCGEGRDTIPSKFTRPLERRGGKVKKEEPDLFGGI